ncbi:molybdenum cofactor guanylyltransferase [Evansella clarkii]|uniref:molybdenum cofactor guanylyltransferase n=1 Tax=Evansella clarkii TaxID=79879 RepID=UPI000B4315E2|nr:molybdenum cofactor guanylyltransferase [Evansella clarkii]
MMEAKGAEFDINGIILAGGKSSRMGKNKAFLEINGRKNIERLTEKMSEITREVIIVTNAPELYEYLNTTLKEDAVKGKGPLAGIQAGITASSAEWNIVAACDLPFFNERAARYLAELTNNQKADAIVPLIDGRQHPLFAAYRASVLPVVEECLSQDRLRIKDALEQLIVCEVTEQEFYEAGFSIEEIADAFFNMNRPEDYKFAADKSNN